MRTNHLASYNNNNNNNNLNIAYRNSHNQVKANIFSFMPQSNEGTSLWNDNLFSSNVYNEQQFDQSAIKLKSVTVSSKSTKSVKARKH